MIIDLKKYLLITAGFASLIMGIIGIFIPVLPTTPFLLLSAGCFLRSSERCYIWLISNPVFGSHIRNYLKYRAISAGSKTASLVLLWFVIILSAVFFVDPFYLKLLLILIASGVTVHILKIRTLTRDMIRQGDDDGRIEKTAA